MDCTRLYMFMQIFVQVYPRKIIVAGLFKHAWLIELRTGPIKQHNTTVFLYLIEETMKKILVIGFVFALSVSSMNNFNISFSGFFKIIICYFVYALKYNLKGNNSKFIYKNIKVKKIYNFKISMFKCIQTF